MRPRRLETSHRYRPVSLGSVSLIASVALLSQKNISYFRLAYTSLASLNLSIMNNCRLGYNQRWLLCELINYILNIRRSTFPISDILVELFWISIALSMHNTARVLRGFNKVCNASLISVSVFHSEKPSYVCHDRTCRYLNPYMFGRFPLIKPKTMNRSESNDVHSSSIRWYSLFRLN